MSARDLTPAVTVHYRSGGGQGRVGLVFAAEWDPARHGKPVNAEPKKCGGIAWYPAVELPEPTYRYSAACVSAWLSGERFSLDGWAPTPSVR